MLTFSSEGSVSRFGAEVLDHTPGSEYIDQMVTDHTKVLRAFTTEAKDTKDAKFRAAVLKGKTMVAAHKDMAYDLKKKL